MSSAADASFAAAADAPTPDLDTDEPAPDDPNFIPWMQKKIKELPLEERREFERILAAMLPGPSRQAGKGAPAPAKRTAAAGPAAVSAPARPAAAAGGDAGSGDEAALVDPALWLDLEKAMISFPAVQEPRKRKSVAPQDEFLALLEHHPEAPLLPIDEMLPWLMELAGKVQQAEKGVKQHWWQLKPKPLAQDGFNDLVQEAAERLAGALFTPERLEQLREEWQDFAQAVTADGDGKMAALVKDALAWLPVAGTPAKGDFLVRFAFLSLRVACRQIAAEAA